MQYCKKGYLGGHYEKKHWVWRCTRCAECRVIVLPYMIRWLDWRWLLYVARRSPEKFGRGVAWLYWHADPIRLLDHLPGFSDGYEDLYNRWAYARNKEGGENESDSG